MGNGIKISIICGYYKEQDLERYLLSSLKKQDFSEYEILAIDNSKEPGASQAATYRKAAERAKGKYLLFVHSDFEFLSTDALGIIDDYCKTYFPKYTILGAAGGRQNKVLTNIKHGIDHELAGEPINRVEEVFSLDECMFIMPKKQFFKYSLKDFGPNIFHLYCVELCCHIKKLKGKVGVIPVEAYHASKGFKDLDYYKTMKRICFQYRNDFKEIYTTCGTFPTGTRYLPLYWEAYGSLWRMEFRKRWESKSKLARKVFEIKDKIKRR